MNRSWLQLAGLVSLTLLAGGLLLLIAYTVQQTIGHVTPDGKVPLLDAGQITAYLLSFQTVVGAIRSIWESQERAALAEGLSNSTPTQSPNPPAGGPVT